MNSKFDTANSTDRLLERSGSNFDYNTLLDAVKQIAKKPKSSTVPPGTKKK